MSDKSKDSGDDEAARKERAKRLHQEIDALVRRKERPAPSSPRDFINEKTRKKS